MILFSLDIYLSRKEHGAVSQIFNNWKELLITKPRIAEKNIVPSLEARAIDGYPVFTQRERLERFRQVCEQERKIGIALLLEGEVTTTGWIEKQHAIQESLLWGVGSLTDLKSERFNMVIHRIIHAEKKHLP